MNAKQDIRLVYGRKVEPGVFDFLQRNGWQYEDTTNKQVDGRYVNYDFIMNGKKYDIKRCYYKYKNCIKVQLTDKYGRNYLDKDCDYYWFTETNNANIYIVVDKYYIRKALEKYKPAIETATDNTTWCYINLDHIGGYVIYNKEEF